MIGRIGLPTVSKRPAGAVPGGSQMNYETMCNPIPGAEVDG